MSEPLNILVIYGSVRSERKGIRAARFMRDTLAGRGHQVTLIDPAEYDLPLLDRMFKEFAKGEAPDAMQRLADRIKQADAFVIVTGEYNHSMPPALKNLLDHYLQEWFFRPSAIVSYSMGSFGGVRAAMQLRVTLAELGMSSIPAIVPVPQVHKQFAEDGTPNDAEAWDQRTAKFLAELEWYAAALKAQRAKGLPY